MTLYQDFLFVPVPEDAYDFAVTNANTLDFWKSEFVLTEGSCDLPPGNWKLFAVSDEVNEEVAKGIVGARFAEKFYHFAPIGMLRPASLAAVHTHDTALSSYTSLLTAAGVTYKRFVILKRS